MTEQEALDYIREHLTKLHANPDIYEDGTCNVIQALEEIVVPMLEDSILKATYILHTDGMIANSDLGKEIEKVTKVVMRCGRHD